MGLKRPSENNQCQGCDKKGVYLIPLVCEKHVVRDDKKRAIGEEQEITTVCIDCFRKLTSK